MTVLHNIAKETNATSAHSRLLAFLERRKQSVNPVEDWERYEQTLHALFIDGVRYHRVLRTPSTYVGIAGEIRLERTLYRASGARQAVVPVELRAGLVEGHWTPLAAKHMTWVAAHLTPAEGEELFQRLGGMQPSKSSLDRVPKALSGHWEAKREAFETALRANEALPAKAVCVAVSLDGVMVPLRRGRSSGSSVVRRRFRERPPITGRQSAASRSLR
ncbi:MAG: hypothetical protein WA970_05490, partial [Gammaproteobacteria bacterium]